MPHGAAITTIKKSQETELGGINEGNSVRITIEETEKVKCLFLRVKHELFLSLLNNRYFATVMN